MSVSLVEHFPGCMITRINGWPCVKPKNKMLHLYIMADYGRDCLLFLDLEDAVQYASNLPIADEISVRRALGLID